MSFVASQNPLSTTRVLQGTTETIAAVDAVVVDTVYSYTFPSGTKEFRLMSDTCADLKIAYDPSGIGNDLYYPVSAGSEYVENFKSLTGKTLYFSSNKANDKVRILSWK